MDRRAEKFATWALLLALIFVLVCGVLGCVDGPLPIQGSGHGR